MDNSYTHNGVISYNLDMSLRDNVMGITLTLDQEERIRVYKYLMIDKYLPVEIK